MRNIMIKIGGFLFRWRDYLFPLTVLLLFASIPPAKTIFGSAALEYIVDIAALLLILSGVLIRMLVIGYVMVRRNGAAKVVHANELYIKGMFGLCRNPLYFGNILIYIGAFLLHGALPVIIGGTALFLFVYYSIIFSEENYLQGRFGEDYITYCSHTPRLLPRLSNWGNATSGMQLKWLRALSVESNVITQSMLIASLALWYEHAANSEDKTIPMISIILLGGSLLSLSILLFKRVRHYRKKQKS